MENNHMNLEFIQKLADLVADKNLGEITVQNGDSTITVKGKKAAAQTVVESLPVAAAAAPLAAAPAVAARFMQPLLQTSRHSSRLATKSKRAMCCLSSNP